MWAAELVHRKASFDRDRQATPAATAVTCSNSITELATDDDNLESDDDLTALPFAHELQTLPPNYAVIRD